MTKHIFLYLAILFPILSNAQKDKNQILVGTFYSDISSISQRENDLPSILKSPNQIEIRLFIRDSWSASRYIVLIYNKTWTITEYIYNYKDKTYASVFEKTDKTLEVTFQNLVKENVFSLRNENDGSYYNFDIKKNKIEKVSSFITDGVSYHVVFKVGDNYREYRFTNPKSYAEFELSNHQLTDFNSIVEIMESEVKK